MLINRITKDIITSLEENQENWCECDPSAGFTCLFHNLLSEISELQKELQESKSREDWCAFWMCTHRTRAEAHMEHVQRLEDIVCSQRMALNRLNIAHSRLLRGGK